jgi:hypothetical protein
MTTTKKWYENFENDKYKQFFVDASRPKLYMDNSKSRYPVDISKRGSVHYTNLLITYIKYFATGENYNKINIFNIITNGLTNSKSKSVQKKKDFFNEKEFLNKKYEEIQKEIKSTKNFFEGHQIKDKEYEHLEYITWLISMLLMKIKYGLTVHNTLKYNQTKTSSSSTNNNNNNNNNNQRKKSSIKKKKTKKKT